MEDYWYGDSTRIPKSDENGAGVRESQGTPSVGPCPAVSMGRPKLEVHEDPDFPESILRPNMDDRGAALSIRGLRPKRAKCGLPNSPNMRERKLRPLDNVGIPSPAENGAGSLARGLLFSMCRPSQDENGAGLSDSIGMPKLDLQDGPDFPEIVLIWKIEDKGAGLRLSDGCPNNASWGSASLARVVGPEESVGKPKDMENPSGLGRDSVGSRSAEEKGAPVSQAMERFSGGRIPVSTGPQLSKISVARRA